MATKTKRTIETTVIEPDVVRVAGPCVVAVREIGFRLSALLEAAQRFQEEPAHEGHLQTILDLMAEQVDALQALAPSARRRQTAFWRTRSLQNISSMTLRRW